MINKDMLKQIRVCNQCGRKEGVGEFEEAWVNSGEFHYCNHDCFTRAIKRQLEEKNGNI